MNEADGQKLESYDNLKGIIENILEGMSNLN